MENASDPEHAWARALSETLDLHFAGGAILPAHLSNRMETLVGDEDLVYVDSSLAGNEPGHTTGRVVAWTEHHVLIADLTYVSLVNPFGPPRHQPVDGDVTLRVIARKMLRGIVVPPRLETNYEWQNAASSWPRHAKVVLNYEGLDQAITVPTEEPRAGFQAFVRGLLKDQLS